jgi:hypothetical protein
MGAACSTHEIDENCIKKVWTGFVWQVDKRRVLMNSVMNFRVP